MENISIFDGQDLVTLNVIPGPEKEHQSPTVLQNYIMKQLDNNTLELVLCENVCSEPQGSLEPITSITNNSSIDSTMHILNFTTLPKNELKESLSHEVPSLMDNQNTVIHHTAKPAPAVSQSQDSKTSVTILEANPKLVNVSVYQCFKCSEQFHTVTLFRQHLKWHKQQKAYTCTKCSAGFNIETNLKVHQVLNHMGSLNYCPICPKMVFHRKAGLRSHVLVHQVEEILTCEECGGEYLTDDELIKHMESHVVVKITKRMAESLVCPYCMLDFQDSADYKQHVDKHMEVKRNVLKGKKTRSRKRIKGDYVCKFCWKIFPKQSLLVRHERIHTGERPHKCLVCGKAFTQSNTLQIHMHNHTGEKPFKCTLCTAKFTQKGNLRTHIIKTHTAPKNNQKVYKCTKCTCIFTKVATLNGHMTKVHVNGNDKDTDTESAIDKVMNSLKLLNNELGNTAFKKNYSLPGTTPSPPHIPSTTVVKVTENRAEGGVRRYSIRQKKIGDVRWYFCNYCTAKFKKPSDVIRHFRIHTLEKPFECAKCSRAFSLKSTLRYHLRVHQRAEMEAKVTRERCLKPSHAANDRPHILSKTENLSHKSIRPETSKQAHVFHHNSQNTSLRSFKQPLYHTNDVKPPKPRIPNTGNECQLERPHHCKICNARFTRLMSLRRHMTQHTNVKKFKCRFCSKAFATKYKLTEHLKSHNNEHDFICEICDKAFVNSTLLKRHLVVHTDVRPYICPYCHKYFKTVILCRGHIRQVHKLDKDIQDESHIASNDPIEPEVHILPENYVVSQQPDADRDSNEVATDNDLQMIYLDLVGNNDEFGNASVPSIKLHNDSYFFNPLNDLLTDTSITEKIVDPNEVISSTNSIKNESLTTVNVIDEVSGLAAVNLADLPISLIDTDSDQNLINGDMIPYDATVFCINCHKLFGDPISFVKHLCSGEVPTKENDVEDKGNIRSFSNSVPLKKRQTYENKNPGSVVEELGLDIEEIQSLPNKKALIKDIEKLEASKNFQCKHCSFKSGFQEKYKKHLFVHQNLTDRVCRFCCKEFRKPSDLKRHIRTHTGEKPFECQTCHKKFSLKSTLLSHMNTHDMVSASKISCDVCNSVFTTKSSLKVHMLLHTGARPHACSFCEQTFRTSATRKTHEMNVHLRQQNNTKSEKPVRVVAEQVGEEVPQKLDPQDRVSVQTLVSSIPETAIILNPDGSTMALDQVLFLPQGSNSNIILTSESGMPFNLGDLTVLGLEDIEIADTGQVTQENVQINEPEPTQKQKKVECDICHKIYSSKDVLRKHKKKLHGQNKKFPCIKCDKGYDQLEELNKHITKLHTGSRPYECPYCKSSFGEEGSMKTHIKRIHSKSGVSQEETSCQDLKFELCYLNN